MIHTIDFLYEVRKSKELERRLLDNMKNGKEAHLLIGDFSLKFDFDRRMVNISCMNPQHPYFHKCPPLDWTFEEMEETVKAVVGDKK